MVRPFGSVSRTWKALAAAVAMALVAVVLIATPGSATFAKKYDLVMSSTPSPIPVGTSATVQATFTNKSLYSIGSVSLTVPSSPSGKFTITGFTPPSSGVVTVAPDGQSLSITGLKLILNKPYSITMAVSVTCDAATGSWASTAKLYGGTTPFTLNNPGNAQKTTVNGACLNKISFVSGKAPSNTAAGGTMSQVQVLVTTSTNAPIANDTVTLTGDIQNSGSVSAATDGSGIATFNSIKVPQTPKSPASLTATEGNGNQSVSGTFDITAASIEFVQQPTTTKFNANINPAVSVKVSSGGNGIEGVPVTITIGTNPAGGVLSPATSVVVNTNANGIAAFDNANALSIGPNESVTSSGYTLLASIDSGSVESDPFAIANEVVNQCGDNGCTATFPSGSTVTTDSPATLIIENDNPDFCSSISTVIAGTVTVIPAGNQDVLLTFEDLHGVGNTPNPVVGQTYKVCKSNDGPGETTLDYGISGDRCSVKGSAPCVENQYFQIGTLNLITKVLISKTDPTMKR